MHPKGVTGKWGLRSRGKGGKVCRVENPPVPKRGGEKQQLEIKIWFCKNKKLPLGNIKRTPELPSKGKIRHLNHKKEPEKKLKARRIEAPSSRRKCSKRMPSKKQGNREGLGRPQDGKA